MIRVVQIENESVNKKMTLKEATRLAEELYLDLVSYTNNGITVYKIIDQKKLEFDQRKKKKASINKPKKTKTIKISYGIKDHDFFIKVKKADAFLEKGHPVILNMVIRGRQINFIGVAMKRCQQFIDALTHYSEYKKQMSKRNINYTIKPK